MSYADAMEWFLIRDNYSFEKSTMSMFSPIIENEVFVVSHKLIFFIET